MYATVLGITYGTLPAYIANELTDQLALLSNGDYKVIRGPALHKELIRSGIDVSNLETANLSGLKVKGAKISALAIGRIRGREGAVFRLGCRLKRTGSVGQIGSANGICFLNESEWAMMGQSAINPDPVNITPGEATAPIMAQHIQALDAQVIDSDKVPKLHPKVNLNFPFTVEIHVKDSNGYFQKREGIVKGNDYHVKLRKGEVYRIQITDRSTQVVFMRLLVDGLNSLPEKMNIHDKGVYVEPVTGEGEWVVAPRVNLAESRAWYLEPATVGLNGEIKPMTYGINGFFKESNDGNDDHYNEFVVTDAPDSAAARKEFTQQIGLITAAFYQSVSPPGPKRLGTGLGKEYKQYVEKYQGDKVPGGLIGVVHIRYDEP